MITSEQFLPLCECETILISLLYSCLLSPENNLVISAVATETATCCHNFLFHH